MHTSTTLTNAQPDQLDIRYVPLEQMRRWERNPKKHDEAGIRDAIVRFGFKDAPKFEAALNGGKGGIVEGNGRSHVLSKMKAEGEPAPRGVVAQDGSWFVPVMFGVDAASEAEAEAYGVSHNNLTMAGGDFNALDFQRMWESEGYSALLGDLAAANELPAGMDLESVNASLSSMADAAQAALNPKMDEDEARRSLAERFGVPPMSVLDARQGYWQTRKNAWLALGLRSFQGRGEGLAYEASAKPPEFYEIRNAMRQRTGVDPSWDEVTAEATRQGKMTPGRSGTSIFDPVLCEIAYRWFCPPSGSVLDPFAGGSVRGLLAAKLGRKYHGVDLREEQVSANEEAWARFQRTAEVDEAQRPRWIVGDSCDIPAMEGLPADFDFVFSCPPYGDLEKYSDDERDLSNMDYADFLKAYFEIIKSSVDRLKEDRFACFVVGEIRDNKGVHRGFVQDTIQAFEEAGARYYNDVVLVTQINSAAIRAGRMFEAGRKLCRTHQNVLVFVKGDVKKAVASLGTCEFGELPEGEDGDA